jgi:hypothetical protein
MHVRSQLTPDRASRLEPQIRARAEQMKPSGTALGICRICSKVVYGGDKLVLTSGSPLHDNCVHTSVSASP